MNRNSDKKKQMTKGRISDTIWTIIYKIIAKNEAPDYFLPEIS